MRSAIRVLTCTALALATTACIARGPEDYRTVTRELVDTRKGDIKSCFGSSTGKVVVDFTVEKKTGKIINPKADSAKSTAPEDVQTCVTKAIDGLGIERPDMRDGAATFTWVFGS